MLFWFFLFSLFLCFLSALFLFIPKSSICNSHAISRLHYTGAEPILICQIIIITIIIIIIIIVIITIIIVIVIIGGVQNCVH